VLFTFLARQMARHADVTVNRSLFEQVVESLCVSDKSSMDLEHEQRQQALLELYAADGLDYFNEARLLELATSAAFYRVCQLVYERRADYANIVPCYWRDPARAHLVFHYVQTVFADRTLSAAQRDRLVTAVLGDVVQLVDIDARRTAKLLVVTLAVRAERVVDELSGDDEVLHSFLSGLFELVSSSPELESSLEAPVHESYVAVMCRLHRSSMDIVTFLRGSSGYRLNATMDICRRHAVTPAVVFLLEKSGDVEAAFNLEFDRLTTTVKACVQSDDVDMVDVETTVAEVIGLLQRGSVQMAVPQLHAVWFTLLDFLMDTLRTGSSAGVLKVVTRHVINSMMSHVPLPAVLERLVSSDDSSVAAQLGDVRDLLTGVLDACCYERTLLSTTARLVTRDLHNVITSLHHASCRPVAVHTDTCACVVCGHVTLGGADLMDVLCFHCGHVIHRTCLTESRDRHVTERQCPLCVRCRCVVSGPFPAVSAASSPGCGRGQLDTVHMASVDRLRALSRSPSRLTVLVELAQVDHTRAGALVGHPRSKAAPSLSMLRTEQFALRLAAPPPPAE